jgi:MFS family permease
MAAIPALAFVSAALAGIGNGTLNPSQSTLLIALARPDLRHRVIAISQVASHAGIGLGSALGGLIAGYGLRGFILLFLANALTYLVYVFVLVAVVRQDVRPEPIVGGYQLVLRDRAFMHLVFTNVAIIGVGWGAFA